MFVETFLHGLGNLIFLFKLSILHGLCIVAIFGHFENKLIFQILAVFKSRFLHRTALMCF